MAGLASNGWKRVPIGSFWCFKGMLMVGLEGILKVCSDGRLKVTAWEELSQYITTVIQKPQKSCVNAQWNIFCLESYSASVDIWDHLGRKDWMIKKMFRTFITYLLELLLCDVDQSTRYFDSWSRSLSVYHPSDSLDKRKIDRLSNFRCCATRGSIAMLIPA